MITLDPFWPVSLFCQLWDLLLIVLDPDAHAEVQEGILRPGPTKTGPNVEPETRQHQNLQVSWQICIKTLECVRV